MPWYFPCPPSVLVEHTEAPQELFLDLLELFRKMKVGLEREKKKLFYSELRVKLKDIFIAFGKDFKWATFQKECLVKQMSEVEPSSRGVTAMMV